MRSALLLCMLLAACKTQAPPATDSGPGGDEGGGEEGGGPDDSGTELHDCTTDRVALGALVCVDEAPCAWHGDQPYGYLGYVIDAGGDIDGDGRADIIVGSPTYDVSGSPTVPDAGRVALISGGVLEDGTDGLVATLPGDAEGGFLGTSLAMVGDVNGDGVDDFIAGARGVTEPSLLQEAAGAAVLVLGQAGGWSDGTMVPTATFYGERAYSRVGTALAGAGDVDGDGLTELLISGELKVYDEVDGDESYGKGRVYLLNGRDGAWPASLADADATFDGFATYEAAGLAMGGGDLDGDGYDDLAIGAPYANGYRGGVYIMQGGPGALEGSHILDEAPVQLSGIKSYDVFGWSLATGDVTGDGIDDLAVGAPLSDLGWPNGGAVYLHAGGPDFFDTGPVTIASYTGEFDDQELGSGLSMGGDLTGDGTGDLVMGAVKTWVGVTTKSGSTYVVPGRETDWPAAGTSAAEAPIIFRGSGTEDYLGRTNALADIDADGTSDLVLGSGYTNAGGNYDLGSVYLFWGGD